MDIQAQVVAGAVHHPAPVVLALGGQGVGGADALGQHPPFLEAGGDHLHGGGVDVLEAAARRARTGEGGVGGVENRLVDPALSLGEATIDRDRASDVSGVEGVDLNAGVHQNQLTGLDGAVIVDPVQGVGVVAGRGDRVIAQAVALLAGLGPEGPLQDPLAAPVAAGPGDGADEVVEAGLGGGDGGTQLVDLPGVLDQAQLAGGLGQTCVHLRGALAGLQPDLLPRGGHQCGDGLVGLGDDAQPHRVGTGILGQRVGQGVDVGAAHAGGGLDLLQGGPHPHPQLAVAGVAVELLAGS